MRNVERGSYAFFDLRVERNWRGVIRPSIRWAPTDEFSIDAKTYIKYKLESDGDRRVDTMVEAKIGVKDAETYRAIARGEMELTVNPAEHGSNA
jgi:hypothetical protein